MAASTSHPHQFHYKVHADPCGDLWHGEGGGAGGVGLLEAPDDEEKLRMSGSHWVPYVDVGEEADGARGGQSLVSVDVGEDSLHGDVGYHERGFAHRQGAHGAAHIRSHAHRRIHHPPGYPQEEAHSSDLCEGTSVSRGEANVGIGAEGSVATRAGTRSPRGVEKLGVMGVGGGSPCRGLVGRSAWGKVSAVDLAPRGRSLACGQQESM